MNNLIEADSAIKPAFFAYTQKTAGTAIINLARSAYGNYHVISCDNFSKELDHFLLAGYEYFLDRALYKKAWYRKNYFIKTGIEKWLKV
jgi:hypothetical protein